jgi:hypothetical protein
LKTNRRRKRRIEPSPFQLYTCDIELMEPICAEVFPGNEIDASSYASFTLAFFTIAVKW